MMFSGYHTTVSAPFFSTRAVAHAPPSLPPSCESIALMPNNIDGVAPIAEVPGSGLQSVCTLSPPNSTHHRKKIAVCSPLSLALPERQAGNRIRVSQGAEPEVLRPIYSNVVVTSTSPSTPETRHVSGTRLIASPNPSTPPPHSVARDGLPPPRRPAVLPAAKVTRGASPSSKLDVLAPCMYGAMLPLSPIRSKESCSLYVDTPPSLEAHEIHSLSPPPPPTMLSFKAVPFGGDGAGAHRPVRTPVIASESHQRGSSAQCYAINIQTPTSPAQLEAMVRPQVRPPPRIIHEGAADPQQVKISIARSQSHPTDGGPTLCGSWTTTEAGNTLSQNLF